MSLPTQTLTSVPGLGDQHVQRVHLHLIRNYGHEHPEGTVLPNHTVELTRGMHDLLRQHRVFLHTYDRYIPQRLTFTDDDEIEPYTGFLAGGTLITMGSFSTSRSALMYGTRVGRYCSIGDGVKVMGDTHPYRWLTPNRFIYDRRSAPTSAYLQDHPGSLPRRNIGKLQKPRPVIQNDVWIAANVTLAKGITVHSGAVVCSNSVVTKDVPPYTIVGGNPAKVIRPRFPDHLIDSLIHLQWWLYEPRQHFHLNLENVDQFVEEFSDLKPKLNPFLPEKFSPNRLLEID